MKKYISTIPILILLTAGVGWAASLTDSKRVQIWAETMSESSAVHESLGTLSKAELRSAVNAIDAWINTNTSSFNSAIPEPARTQLTTKQKLKIFLKIMKIRWEVE